MTIELRWAVFGFVWMIFGYIFGRVGLVKEEKQSKAEDAVAYFIKEKFIETLSRLDHIHELRQTEMIVRDRISELMRLNREISSRNKAKDLLDYIKFSEPYGLNITGGINYIELEMYLDYSKQIGVGRTAIKKRINKIELNEEVMMGMLEIMKRELELRTK